MASKIHTNQMDFNGTTQYPSTATVITSAGTTMTTGGTETFTSTYSGTYQNGANVDFGVGASVDFTGATVTGLPGITGLAMYYNYLAGVTGAGYPYYMDTSATHSFGISSGMLMSRMTGMGLSSRNITTDTTNYGTPRGCSLIGDYLYIYVNKSVISAAPVLLRYDLTSLSTAPVVITFAGGTVPVWNVDQSACISNGTDFYISYNAGNSSNAYIFAKYTLSGTTLTYSTSISFGSQELYGIQVPPSFTFDGSGNLTVFCINGPGAGVTQFDNTGTQTYQDAGDFNVGLEFPRIVNINDTIYVASETSNMYLFAQVVL